MTHSLLTHLECSVCGTQHSHQEVHTVCRSCGKSLLARYDLKSASSYLVKSNLNQLPPTFWKFAPVLPVQQMENRVSLGERITPILHFGRIGEELNLTKLFVKDEGQLPTGSFKARGLALAVSRAKELGLKKLCIPSAGNAAGALAAYAACAGLEAHIFLPEDTPEINIKESIACGAHVQLVKGNISDAAKAMNARRASEPSWFDVSTLKEPYRLEGKKMMGYELAEQFEWVLPDVIIYPTGGGTGLIGMWKAFEEMEAMGWIDHRRPKMVSVQPTGCAPIVRAFEQQQKESTFWEDAQTIASGLRVPKAFADYLILDVLFKSKGKAVAVSDAEIIKEIRTVARQEGLLMCPEGAAGIVALRQVIQSKYISSSDTVLVFNTAAGTKYPEAIERS